MIDALAILIAFFAGFMVARGITIQQFIRFRYGQTRKEKKHI